MIIPDHKKIATVIVSRMGKGDAAMKPEEDVSGDPVQALAEDLLHAIETKSASALADAFKALSLACATEPEDDEGGYSDAQD